MARQRAARALTAWADALRGLIDAADEVHVALHGAVFTNGDERSAIYEQGRIIALSRMLAPIETETRMLAETWARVASFEAGELSSEEPHGPS